MTLIRTIISDALREGGILALGDTPEAASEDEGLRRLNSMIRSLFGKELGEKFASYSYGSNGVTTVEGQAADVKTLLDVSYLPSNSRLFLNLSNSATVYLDPNPQDGARLSVVDASRNFGTYNLTLNGNGRRIENSPTIVLNTDGTTSEWFYRSDLGSWYKSIDLSLNDPSPFPVEFDDLLIILLAMRLNPRYGQQTGADSQAMLGRFRSQFRARYSQTTEIPSEDGLLRLSSTNDRMTGSSVTRFSKGLI